VRSAASSTLLSSIPVATSLAWEDLPEAGGGTDPHRVHEDRRRAKTLEALAARAAGDITAAAADLHDALAALERSVSDWAPIHTGATITDHPSLGLYHSLAAASPEPLAPAQAS
jgi:hypothetical protein